MDESLWSSPEVILPPRPLSQVPIMALNRVMPSGMSSLPMFVRRHLAMPLDVEMRMKIELQILDEIDQKILPDTYYIQVYMGELPKTEDPRVYWRSGSFRLTQEIPMPEMDFKGQKVPPKSE